MFPKSGFVDVAEGMAVLLIRLFLDPWAVGWDLRRWWWVKLKRGRRAKRDRPVSPWEFGEATQILCSGRTLFRTSFRPGKAFDLALENSNSNFTSVDRSPCVLEGLGCSSQSIPLST